MSVTAIIPQLRTPNLDAAIDFYVKKLGFVLDFRFDDFYAGVRVGKCLIHLKLVDEPDPSIDFVAKGEHLHLYFECDDVDARARQYETAGVSFVGSLQSTEWGTREFYVVDRDGHTLCFGQTLP